MERDEQTPAPEGLTPLIAQDVVWNAQTEPTPENLAAWALRNWRELRAYAKEKRKSALPGTGKDVGAMDAAERRALIQALMAEEYVLIGGVWVAKAKAADFVTKKGEIDPKTLREFQALRELAAVGYQAFLFREQYNHSFDGYYGANADGAIGMRFVDVKYARTLGSIQTAMNKSVRQGEGTVLVYDGNENVDNVIDHVKGELKHRAASEHFVFLKMGNDGQKLFIPPYKYRSGTVAGAATSWPGARKYHGALLALPQDNITAKPDLSRNDYANEAKSINSNASSFPGGRPGGAGGTAMRRGREWLWGLVIAALGGVAALAAWRWLDVWACAKALPYKDSAEDLGTRLGGALALVKIFGVADSLAIFVMAAGALGYRRAACRMLIAFCVVGATVLPLKHVVGRARPDQSENVSFPSGDTATASVLPTALAGTLPVTAASGAIAGGVAFSRVMFRRHFCSDVLAGMTIGLLAGLLARWLLRLWLAWFHWLPPRWLFLLGMAGALFFGAAVAFRGGHHRHVVQLVAWFGPVLALLFAADWHRHARRERAPAPAPAGGSGGAGDAGRMAKFAAGFGLLVMAGVWLPDLGAARLPLFSAGLGLLAFAILWGRLRRARRFAAARAFAFAAAKVALVWTAGYLGGVL